MIKLISSMPFGFLANLIIEDSNPISNFGIWLVGWLLTFILLSTLTFKRKIDK